MNIANSLVNKSLTPKVSVIVPVYNTENYLQRCLESIINQTLNDIEIILVVDASPDNSEKICDDYAKKDLRINVIHQEKGGVSKARNKGLNQSLGEFIMFLDSDDWIDKNTCENALNAAIANNADVVFWSTTKEFHSGKSLQISIVNNNRVFENEEVHWLHRRMVGLVGKELSFPTKTDAFNSVWGKLYRRKVLTESCVIFYDQNIVGSEDVLFNIHLFKYVKKAVYIHHFFNHYRQDNPNALTRNHNSTLFPRFLELFKHIQTFIDDIQLPKDYQIALKNRISLSVINNILSISSPNNPQNFFQKINAIDFVLHNDVYKSAIKELTFDYLPNHWKVFFLFCKFRLVTGVYLMSLAMRFLRRRI